jgi:hypothetical protein
MPGKASMNTKGQAHSHALVQARKTRVKINAQGVKVGIHLVKRN